MAKAIICAKCGKKVFPYCTNSECIKWREEISQYLQTENSKAQEKLKAQVQVPPKQ